MVMKVLVYDKIKKVILKVSHHINEENVNKSKINEDDE